MKEVGTPRLPVDVEGGDMADICADDEDDKDDW